MHPLCKGSLNIRRYSVEEISKSILFPYLSNIRKAELITPKEFQNKFPKIWDYLLKNRKALESRERGKWKHDKWYAFGRSQNLNEMEQAKILTPSIANKASYVYDNINFYYFVGSGGGGGGGYGITIKEGIPMSYEYLLGLLNSKLLDSYLQSYSSPFRGGYFAYNRQYIEKLPIYIPDPTDKQKFAITQKIEDLVKQILEFRKNEKIADAEFLERKIDEMVEVLYGVV